MVFAKEVDATAGGLIHADGFVGGPASIGSATSVGGGGGGEGGWAELIYRRAIGGRLPTLRASGGSGGAPAGTGGYGRGGTPGWVQYTIL
jgi:hypothetical protein